MRVWTVSEVKAGTLTQCLGVARHFDPSPHQIIVGKALPRWKYLTYRLPGRLPGDAPDMIVSCGGKAQSHVMAMCAALKRKPVTVHLAGPGPEFVPKFDMAFVSRHDWSDAAERAPNLEPMTGVPHQITTAEIASLRPAARARWLDGHGRAVTVLIGGQNRAYLYDPATVDGLIETIRDLADRDWTVLVSTSRRSDPTILTRLLELESRRIKVWDRKGENPYRDFLAAADALLVTKDSITMACEALATGMPTYVIDLLHNPCPRLTKFERFHHDMSETLQLTRPWAGEIAEYTYEPLAEAARIAKRIEDRFGLAAIVSP